MTQQDVAELLERIDTNHQRLAEKIDTTQQRTDQLFRLTSDLLNDMHLVFTTLGFRQPDRQNKIRALQDLTAQLVKRHNDNTTRIDGLQATVNQLAEAIPDLREPKRTPITEATPASNLAGIDAVITRLREHEHTLGELRQRVETLTATINDHVDDDGVL